MTPHDTIGQIGALVIAVSPVLTIAAGVLTVWIQHRRNKAAENTPAPALGITVDDDHADEAIQALREARDDWRARAQSAEAERDRLRLILRAGIPDED